MKNKIEDFYVTQFAERGFTPAPNNLDYCEVGTTWQLNDNIGTGTFWIYNRQNLFAKSVYDAEVAMAPVPVIGIIAAVKPISSTLTLNE